MDETRVVKLVVDVIIFFVIVVFNEFWLPLLVKINNLLGFKSDMEAAVFVMALLCEPGVVVVVDMDNFVDSAFTDEYKLNDNDTVINTII